MLALAAALPILCSVGLAGPLGNVEVASAVFVNAQAAVGTAPQVPGAEPEPTLETELRPGAGLRLRTPTTLTILRVEPRILHRTPNFADMNRPLFFVRGGATHSRELSQRTVLLTTADASYGEVDYLSAPLAFGATPLVDVEEPVLRIVDVDATTGLTLRTSESNTLTLTLLGGYTSLVAREATQAFPETFTAGVTATQAWRLDPRTSLSLPAGVERYFVAPGPDWLVFSTGLGYGRELDARTTFGAEAGLSLYKVDDEASWQPLPTGLLSLERVLFQRPTGRVTGRASAAFDALYDPTVGEVFPTAAVELSWAARSDRGWGATLHLDAHTAFGVQTDEPAPGASPPGATYLSGVSAVEYEFMRGLRGSGGLRISTRSSSLESGEFRMFDRQTFVFIALTAVLGLAKDDEGAWAL